MVINNKEIKVVCIVGKIASGKTTVASELASVIGREQFSVSDYLKYCLKSYYVFTTFEGKSEHFRRKKQRDFDTFYMSRLYYEISQKSL